MRRVLNPFHLLATQRGYLFPWAPVCLGVGIGTYFGLSEEPQGIAFLLLTLGVLFLLGLARLSNEEMSPVTLCIALILAGVVVAGVHAHRADAPKLGFRYYGPIEGRVVNIDRSQSNKLRITLDHVVLENVTHTPHRVRVSLHDRNSTFLGEIGAIVILTGHLSPPQGPAEPGGFDFRRKAWFERLGAVGYTRSPVLVLSPPTPGNAVLKIRKLRQDYSHAIQNAVPGEAGAFAAAIMTGDRSAISTETMENLRRSNLAHLLAISGLHMGLLTAFVFGSLRYGLALLPFLALRLPVKKISAVAALCVATGYLLLSGGSIATVRAYIMVAVMLTAVCFDRRALTLRAVAVAALIVLVLYPQSLIGPGFQMSFAATTALVAVFGALQNWQTWKIPKALRPVLALLVSSAIAGVATAPIAAAHFNQIAQYGLLANLLTVPMMGSVVIPSAVVALLLTPFGLSWVGFVVMRLGIKWILAVANWVANLEGAAIQIVTPVPIVLPLIVLGALFLVLWAGKPRFLGILGLAAGFFLWAETERPQLLISETGGLIGLMTDQGRALSKPRGDGFTALSWLENDGDAADQDEAYARRGFEFPENGTRFTLGGVAFVHLTGKAAVPHIETACASDQWIITSIAQERPREDCEFLDADYFKQNGSIAIYVTPTGLRRVTAAERAGNRLWTRR